MTTTENIQILPIGVWLSFAIITIGIISIIYSRGNWRLTVMLMGLALLAVLFANESEHFQTYLNTHFIGSYDQVGIPFIQVHPGWSLILNTWPLWLLPIVVTSVLTWTVCIIWQRSFPKKTVDDGTEIEEITTTATQNVAKQLETATFKQDLITALHTIDKQAIDNQALEFKIRQLTKEQQEKVAYLESQIRTLTTALQTK